MDLFKLGSVDVHLISSAHVRVVNINIIIFHTEFRFLSPTSLRVDEEAAGLVGDPYVNRFYINQTHWQFTALL